MAYASKYYDPVKAHEYYEKHKQLKGRQTTKGLNDLGKSAAKSAKERINAEKNQVLDRLKAKVNARIASLRERIKSQLANMPKEAKQEKAALRAKLKQEVASIRESWRGQRDAIKTEYNEKYYQELERLKSNRAMTASNKSVEWAYEQVAMTANRRKKKKQ